MTNDASCQDRGDASDLCPHGDEESQKGCDHGQCCARKVAVRTINVEDATEGCQARAVQRDSAGKQPNHIGWSWPIDEADTQSQAGGEENDAGNDRQKEVTEGIESKPSASPC